MAERGFNPRTSGFQRASTALLCFVGIRLKKGKYTKNLLFEQNMQK